MADKEKTRQEAQIEAEIAASQENPTPSTAANLRAPPPVQKRAPSPGVKQFVVRTRGVPHFRRAGLMFSPDPVTLEVSSLTPAQRRGGRRRRGKGAEGVAVALHPHRGS